MLWASRLTHILKPLSRCIDQQYRKVCSVRSLQTRCSQTRLLPSGQTIGFREFGHENGSPVFYFHGTPGSRLEALGFEDYAKTANARLISVDRPGIGLSSPLSSKLRLQSQLMSWPGMIQQLADQLQLDRFTVMGASGGGPYAISCAHSIPRNRLRRTAVVAGMGPIEYGFSGTSWQRYLAFQTNRYMPVSWLKAIIHHSFVRPAQTPDPGVFEAKVIDKFINHALPKEDRVLYKDPKTRRDLILDWRQAFNQGAEGYVDDAKTIFSPWPFELENVKGRVHLWYGIEDDFTPVGMGRYMAAHMPNAKLREMSGDSHASIGDHGAEILADLIRS